MLYSSSMAEAGARYLVLQATWCGLGLVLCLLAAWLDYRIWKKLAWPMLIGALVMLVLVFVPPVGIHRNGASRWLGWHGMSLFQPSEFAKLALIVALAWYAERFQRQMNTFKRGVLIPGIFAGVILGLIFREPDYGGTILLASVTGTMLLIGGVRWKFILPPILAGMGGVAFSIWHDPVRTRRIFAWLNPEETKGGVGYQAYQAMLALGAGGWNGLGLGNGRQKLGFVPYHHTDFIFSIIGEELGLIATMLVIVAFVGVFFCAIYIALNAPDTFGLLLGSGIAFLIGLQAFINIGVVTSALPNKGLPLPFISYGGSNLLLMLTCVGLLLSIARRARVSEGISSRASTEEPVGNPFARKRQASAA